MQKFVLHWGLYFNFTLGCVWQFLADTNLKSIAESSKY